MDREYSEHETITGGSTADLEEDDITAAEQALNMAIVAGDIAASYEEYLDIFDAFYSDPVSFHFHDDDAEQSDKGSIRCELAGLLLPIHVLAEVGGVTVTLIQKSEGILAGRQRASAWTMQLLGLSGNTTTVSWRLARTWNEERRVDSERYSDWQQTGESLGPEDVAWLSVSSFAD